MRISGDERVHVVLRQRADQSLADRLEGLAQPRPGAAQLAMVGLELLAECAEARGFARVGDALLEERGRDPSPRRHGDWGRPRGST
jgi:hypothetical protein